jgi:hypothetical protein
MKNILATLGLAAALAAGVHAAPMGTAITYQGRLNDGGHPANNLYDLTFTLHDDPVNVASVGTYIILPAVPVTNGLFTVQLNANGEFGPSAFTGQARWLQIGVRTNSANNAFNNFTFLAPRQPLTPAPCALFASNATQAATANLANSATTAQTANVANSVAWANITGVPAGFADGVDNDTTYTAGGGLSLSGANQFSVNFAGAGSANTAARSDHNHFGANWSGASSGYGLTVINNSTTGTGFYSQQGTGSGTPVPIGYKAAVWGDSSQGDAVYGVSGNVSGTGVYGYASALSGITYGVYGQSDSPGGTGVTAVGSGTNGTALRISKGAIRVTGAGLHSTTAPVFVHEITTNNAVYSFFGGNLIYSVVDNPYCNDNPDAILTVTGHWKKFDTLFVPKPAVVMVVYDEWGNYSGPPGRWLIAASVGALELEQRYNVMIITP